MPRTKAAARGRGRVAAPPLSGSAAVRSSWCPRREAGCCRRTVARRLSSVRPQVGGNHHSMVGDPVTGPLRRGDCPLHPSGDGAVSAGHRAPFAIIPHEPNSSIQKSTDNYTQWYGRWHGAATRPPEKGSTMRLRIGRPTLADTVHDHFQTHPLPPCGRRQGGDPLRLEPALPHPARESGHAGRGLRAHRGPDGASGVQLPVPFPAGRLRRGGRADHGDEHPLRGQRGRPADGARGRGPGRGRALVARETRLRTGGAAGIQRRRAADVLLSVTSRESLDHPDPDRRRGLARRPHSRRWTDAGGGAPGPGAGAAELDRPGRGRRERPVPNSRRSHPCQWKSRPRARLSSRNSRR
ncbi:hypothetical protein NG2371_03786 [Nocardia gamkensis]|nr:hypothetical protein [Nocardia gamkensis]